MVNLLVFISKKKAYALTYRIGALFVFISPDIGKYFSIFFSSFFSEIIYNQTIGMIYYDGWIYGTMESNHDKNLLCEHSQKEHWMWLCPVSMSNVCIDTSWCPTKYISIQLLGKFFI